MDVYNPDIDGIDYAEILSECHDRSIEEIIAFLHEELPYRWCDVYRHMTTRKTDIWRFWRGSFEYIFDCCDISAVIGAMPRDGVPEERLVAVLGRSNPIKRARDDYRLRGWCGRTESSFGKGWDKGHFIAHTLGGAISGSEANVFVQRRDVNRGWSESGKRFRAMEKYCFMNPSTFCFNRPIYKDDSSRPAFYEFGVLKSNKKLWVECFDNRL